MLENKQTLLKIIPFILLLAVIGLAYSLYGPRGKKTSTPLFSPQNPARLFSASSPNPAQILNLESWSLTLPIESKNDSESPLIIKQPELATYQLSPWFKSTEDKKGVAFRSPVNAPTTANSNYPRSELREMTSDGAKEFFWSSIEGTHTMFIDQAITAAPQNKPDVVAGQIHGDDDDLLVIRLEYPKLYIARGRSQVYTLDDNYTLGKRFTVEFVASDGKISVYYNDSPSPVYTLDKEVKKAYFKAGVYTQSNCETEDWPGFCSADNYGEVVIYRIEVSHEN